MHRPTSPHDAARVGTDTDRIVTIPAVQRWPLAIVVGLLIVIAVNFTFIYVAVSGADPVVPSYQQSDR